MLKHQIIGLAIPCVLLAIIKFGLIRPQDFNPTPGALGGMELIAFMVLMTSHVMDEIRGHDNSPQGTKEHHSQNSPQEAKEHHSQSFTYDLIGKVLLTFGGSVGILVVAVIVLKIFA